MRYRGHVCITIDPDVLRLFDAAVFSETHTNRARSKAIKAMTNDRIAAWQKRERQRVIAWKVVNGV